MLRVIGLVTALTVAVAGPRVHEEAIADGAACIPADQCCAVCDKGKACGNSCISRAKTCHKGRGCACNLVEVCASE